MGAGKDSDLELVEEKPSGSEDGVLGCSLSAPAGNAGAGDGLPAVGYFNMNSSKRRASCLIAVAGSSKGTESAITAGWGRGTGNPAAGMAPAAALQGARW